MECAVASHGTCEKGGKSVVVCVLPRTERRKSDSQPRGFTLEKGLLASNKDDANLWIPNSAEET